MNEMHTPPVKQLRRTRDGRMIAGVCSGIGEYTGIDANILRIALGVATLFGGLGIGVYAVAWLLMPEEGKTTSIVQDLIDKQKAKSGGPGGWQPHSGWQGHSGRQGPAASGHHESAPAPSGYHDSAAGTTESRPEEAAPPAATPRPAPGDQPRTDV